MTDALLLRAGVTIEPTWAEALAGPQRESWLRGLARERANFIEGVTYRRVPRAQALRSRRSIVRTKLVCRIKGSSAETYIMDDQFKVRFTARGDQQRSSEVGPTFSPCPSATSSRLVTVCAVQHGWQQGTTDVASAFLQATFAKHERVYVDPPPEWEPDRDFVWELLRSMYGLRVAGRVWSDVANDFMTTLEFRGRKFIPTTSDPCVYTWRDKHGRLGGVVDLHVDDFRQTGRPALLAYVQEALARQWKVTSKNNATRHLGVNYTWSEDRTSVELNQHDKIDDMLTEFNMAECRSVEVPAERRLRKARADEPITPQEEFFMRNKPFGKGVGCLLWLSRMSRPDIEWVTNHLSQFLADPRPSHWLLLERVLRYLKGTKHYVLRYTRSGGKVLVRTDSDWAPKEANERRSTSGRVILTAGGAVSWKSNIQKNVIAQSSAEAELVALASGAQEAMWIKRFLKELDLDDGEPLEIQVDNNACKQIANNRMLSERTKGLDIRYFAIREYIKKKHLVVNRVDTKDNTADIFTKPLQAIKFKQFRRELGIGPSVLNVRNHS